MDYTLLLWPHANARYRSETLRLAEAELDLMLRGAAEGYAVSRAELPGMAALDVTVPGELSGPALDRILRHSLMYGLFRKNADGTLAPLSGRAPAAVGEDLPGILKYKGKTNELFTALLLNAALYSGAFAFLPEEEIRVLDPMCGRGTTLFVALNRGWKAVGSDIDRADLREAEKFFERYLQYHRLKHSLEHGAYTVEGRPRRYADFAFSADPESLRRHTAGRLRLVEADAREADAVFGREAFHLICCDLPYGVQHGPRGGSVAQLLKSALPGWRRALKPGGAVAVAMNVNILKTDTAYGLMEEAGFRTPGDRPCFSHWVEQAVTRDIAVCIKD
ncbi:MAG: hypothetical protein IJH78_01130 [Clostridia bacterium]|nr:hypothetical protein [Clostridia bacterium]